MRKNITSQVNKLLGAYENGDSAKHPLIALQRIAMRAESLGDDNLAFQCYKELAQYVAPKLKSVEIRQEVEEVKPITIVLDYEGSAPISLVTEALEEEFAEWE